MNVAIVHDYITQRGGAERVVLSMQKAFPSAPLHTSLYQPQSTFPEFGGVPVTTMGLNRFPLLRRNHRLALPFLAAAFSAERVCADVVLCSSSGWAHGVRAEGRKVVYCYTPARWLYDGRRYLGERQRVASAALAVLQQPLRRWDRRAAATADRYLTLSSVVRDRVWAAYGIEAEVIPPPPTIAPQGAQSPVAGIEPGFLLCVARLLPYKNVEVVVEAFRGLPDQRLVVIGEGPSRRQLTVDAPSNVRVVGSVTDDELRWLYTSAVGVVAAGHEDFGLTPLEAASFGKPSAVLRWGGYLDTVREGETGLFFGAPEPAAIRETVTRLAAERWDDEAIRVHARRFSEARFIDRLRKIVAEEGSFR